MEHQEKTEILRRILNRQFYIELPVKDGVYTVKYIDPSGDIIALADFEYKKIWRLNEGVVPTIEQTVQQLKDRGSWSDKLDADLEKAHKDLKNIRLEIDSNKYFKSRQETLIKMSDLLQKRIDKLHKDKYAFVGMSLEALCGKLKKRVIVRKCACILEDPKLIEDPNVTDDLAVLIEEEDARITERIIRELARSQPFRGIWKTSQETGTSLFAHSCSEMTDLQLALISWALIYDYAYTCSDAPDIDIINNDDKFDAWYQARGSKDGSASKIETKNGDFNEIFIPCDQDGAKEVYKLNDAEGTIRLKQRMEYMKKHGEVKEIDMPDTKQLIRMKATNLEMKRGTK